jgi:hypothetical protein
MALLPLHFYIEVVTLPSRLFHIDIFLNGASSHLGILSHNLLVVGFRV